MTTPQATDERARQYIDSVVAINRKYGMDGSISDEDYNEAVTAAADAFRGLRPATDGH